MGDAVSQTVARPPTTSSLQKSRTLFILPFPVIVWGVDELWRWDVRRRAALRSQALGL